MEGGKEGERGDGGKREKQRQTYTHREGDILQDRIGLREGKGRDRKRQKVWRHYRCKKRNLMVLCLFS